jgi:nitrobindin-like protein
VPDLHPDVASLAPLLGVWAGQGRGVYPTIAPFGYLEEVTFGHVGKPFLSYAQKTRAIDDGRPLHAETGYLRVASDARVELILAHPTGVTEIEEGTVSVHGTRIEMELAATTIGRSGSAKEVTALGRTIRVDGDELTYTVSMGAVGHPLQQHLTATLRRTSIGK